MANGVEEGQLHQCVVCQVPAFLRDCCDDLGAEARLDIRMQCEEMQDARESIRGRVHACKDERAAGGRW